MFNELVGSYQMVNGSFIVLRLNHRDGYVTHIVYPSALVMVPLHVTDKMDRLRLAEGCTGIYYGDDRPRAIAGWFKRIAEKVGLPIEKDNEGQSIIYTGH